MAQIRRNKLDFKDTCKERKSLLRKMCQNTDFVRRTCSCTRKYESEKALVLTNFVKWLTDSVITSNYCSDIVRKVSKYGVFSGQYLSVFSLNAGKNAWLCDCFVKINQLCSIQKQPPDVFYKNSFLKYHKIHRKTPVLEGLF